MALAVLPAYVQDSTTPLVTSAVAAAQRAIAIDSTIPESYAALGYAYSLLGELGRRRRASDARRARLDRGLDLGMVRVARQPAGRFSAPRTNGSARGRALEPASLIARIWEAQVLDRERRFAAADSLASATIALDSTFMLAWTWRAMPLLAMGRTRSGQRCWSGRSRCCRGDGRRKRTACWRTRMPGRAGRRKRGRCWDDARASRAAGSASGAIAAALEELGDHEAAVALFEEAIAQHDVWLVQFPRSERYDKLRRDPRAAEMLDRLGKVH